VADVPDALALASVFPEASLFVAVSLLEEESVFVSDPLDASPDAASVLAAAGLPDA
jgi:hypothetical protein